METHSSILTWRTSGQRSLVGYSPQGRKDSDTTEQLHSPTHSLTHQDKTTNETGTLDENEEGYT